MEHVKIVVWDNIGNTLLGVRPWDSWPPHIKARLLAEDSVGPAHAPDLYDILEGYEVDLVWFQTAMTGPEVFGALSDDFPGSLRSLTSMEDLGQAIEDADYVVIHKERLPGEVLRCAEQLRLLQHLGQDYRGMPLGTAREMGIPVAATPLVNYIAVAEHVWAFIFNHLKQLPSQAARMRAREYDATSWGIHPNLKLVRNQTIGLLGLGEIARQVARVAHAFEIPTIYWDIERFPEIEEQYGVTYVDWDEIFRRSDVLSVQLALNEKTEGIIGAREIGLMKLDALFINTARGKLVDQAALVKALQEGRLGGAALDVYVEEPLPVDDPLHALHETPDANVTLTPHSAWQSPWTWIRDSQGLWYNVLRSLRGQPIEHLV